MKNNPELTALGVIAADLERLVATAAKEVMSNALVVARPANRRDARNLSSGMCVEDLNVITEVLAPMQIIPRVRAILASTFHIVADSADEPTMALLIPEALRAGQPDAPTTFTVLFVSA